MTFLNYYKEGIDTPTKEMRDYFNERTNNHIDLVKKYASIIESIDEDFNGLISIANDHDASKFEDIERLPYIFITWKYYAADNGIPFEISDSMKNKMADATLHHILNNKHHPEYWSNKEDVKLNDKDRDKPSDKIVIAYTMPNIYIGEMLADWKAVGEERGNTVRSWFDSNNGKRWKFSPSQEKLINKVINEIE